MSEKRYKALGCFTDEELETELIRRKGPPKPLPSEDVSLASLSNEVGHYLLAIQQNERSPKDGEQHIFELAMKTFYGPDIFDWINEHNLGN